MAEKISTGYKRLFEVRILHHFWLDEGAAIFDSLQEATRNKRLLNYDISGELTIRPTPQTLKTIQGLHAVARQTGIGLVVAVPENQPITNDTVFMFTIEVNKHSFGFYTAFTLQNRKIYECYSPGDDKIYRYKENIPVFSNLTGVSRGNGSDKKLFLSKEFPAMTAADQVEYLVISGNALLQLTGSQPGAATQLLHANASAMPVFYNQDDAPVIVPPAGTAGAPARGVELSSEIPDSVFGIIRIAAVKPGDADYSCTAGGFAKDAYPVFQIRFRNRSVTWKYLNKNTGTPVSESASPLPLTHSGNAGTKQKPLAGQVKAEFEDGDPTKRIERIYTEIFE